MTQLQKKIFEVLFRGGHIVKLKPGEEKQQISMFDLQPSPLRVVRYSVREKDFKLVFRITHKNTAAIFRYCRKVRKYKVWVWEINRQAVLSLNGNSWLKKTYKKIRSQQKAKCNPCEAETIIPTHNKLSL